MSTPPDLSSGRRWAALSILCIAALVISIDLTVLQLAIPSLTKDLDPSSTQILWIADIYGLVMAGLLVTMGVVGDRIGRKKLLVFGAFAFAAASVLSAWAPSAGWLIADRAILGIAGATIYPTTLSVIRNIFRNPKERATAVGIWTAMVSGGTALGPIVGGPLLANFWWGSVFLINLPLMAAVFIGGMLLVPESRNPRPGRLDIPSVLLSVLGIVGVVYAIQESVHDGIGDPKIYLTGIFGVLALVIFVLRQPRLENPIFDVTLFRSRSFAGAVAANASTMFASIGVLLLLSQYFQFIHNWTPFEAAMALLPPAGMSILCAPLLGTLIPMLGKGRVVSLGLALLTIAMFLYSRASVDSGYVTILIPTLFHGAAAALIFAVTVDIIVNSAPKEKSGVASGIATTAGELGAAMGMAVLGTILNSVYRNNIKLPAEVTGPARTAARDSVGAALDVAKHLPAGLAHQVSEGGRSAFMHGMHFAALTNAVLLGVICLISLVALRGLPSTFGHDDDGDEFDETSAEESASLRAHASQPG
jgi:DHA2 family multidrug resistance protein-like MFS transporter